MPELPASPVLPKEFFESWLPEAYATSGLAAEGAGLEVTLGVRLEGDGGGEWLMHVRGGALQVEPGSREKAAFSVVQSVEDWRGALWEERGGFLGRQAASLFRPEARAAAPGGMGSLAPSPAALGMLSGLDGVIRMVVAGGTGGDWRVDFKLGRGPLPDEPTTTVTIAAADADAMAQGKLDPMQAFMAGRIQVAGDMALLMQVQAIQMQAALAAASRPPGGKPGA
jgi:hypothetical protein